MGKKKRPKLPPEHPFAGLQDLRDEMRDNERDGSDPDFLRVKRKARTAKVAPEPEAFDFEAEMDDVQPMPDHRPRVPQSPKKTASPLRKRINEDEQMLRDLGLWVDKGIEFQIAQDAERIEGAVSGLNPKTRKKLRQGAFAIQAHLDLHGMDTQGAFEATEEFILSAIKDGLRCLLIVHGKGIHSKSGTPVLKMAMKKWLTRGKLGRCILAFTTARPCDGGHGAIYVLLRAQPAAGDGKKTILRQE